MRGLRGLLLLACVACAGSVLAEDNVLLIQTGPQGFIVWHVEGPSNLPEDEILDIMATAESAGGPVHETALGPARGYEMPAGVVIRLAAVKGDNALLVDRDACGHVQIWHATGTTRLSDEDITDIVLSALPGGGKRITLGDHYVKAFTTKLGVTATLWRIPAKNR